MNRLFGKQQNNSLVLHFTLNMAVHFPMQPCISIRFLILIGILGFVASFAISIGPVMWVLFSELFQPNSWAGYFLCRTDQQCCEFYCTTGVSWELEKAGSATTFFIYGVFALLGFLFIWRYVPETKGKKPGSTGERAGEIMISRSLYIISLSVLMSCRQTDAQSLPVQVSIRQEGNSYELWWTGHPIPSKEQVWNLAVLLNWQNTEEILSAPGVQITECGQPLTSWMKHIHMASKW